MCNLVLDHLGHPPDLRVELLLLRIESQSVDLLDKVLHLIVVDFLLKHELQIGPLDLALEHALDICKSGS